MFFVVFDIDGVLVDTKELVHQAYRDVGVDMPVGAWGKAWTEWLPEASGSPWIAQGVHDLKTKRYIDLLTESPPPRLSGGEALEIIMSEGLCDVAFATGASRESAALILMQLGVNLDLHTNICGATAPMKTMTLAMLRGSALENDVVYIDDDEVNGRRIARDAGVSFVHYHGQDPLLLMEDVWTA